LEAQKDGAIEIPVWFDVYPGMDLKNLCLMTDPTFLTTAPIAGAVRYHVVIKVPLNVDKSITVEAVLANVAEDIAK
jgi:hypothetical protein